MKIKKTNNMIDIKISMDDAEDILCSINNKYNEFFDLLYCVVHDNQKEIQSLNTHQKEILWGD